MNWEDFDKKYILLKSDTDHLMLFEFISKNVSENEIKLRYLLYESRPVWIFMIEDLYNAEKILSSDDLKDFDEFMI